MSLRRYEPSSNKVAGKNVSWKLSVSFSLRLTKSPYSLFYLIRNVLDVIDVAPMSQALAGPSDDVYKRRKQKILVLSHWQRLFGRRTPRSFLLYLDLTFHFGAITDKLKIHQDPYCATFQVRLLKVSKKYQKFIKNLGGVESVASFTL